MSWSTNLEVLEVSTSRLELLGEGGLHLGHVFGIGNLKVVVEPGYNLCTIVLV